MSDLQLRELEHDLALNPAHETTWLHHRLRCGALSAAHVELAARLEHPGAAAVVGQRDPAPRSAGTARGVTRISDWLFDAVAALGEAGRRQAVLAVARTLDEGEDPVALAACEVWVSCPCAMHSEALATAATARVTLAAAAADALLAGATRQALYDLLFFARLRKLSRDFSPLIEGLQEHLVPWALTHG